VTLWVAFHPVLAAGRRIDPLFLSGFLSCFVSCGIPLLTSSPGGTPSRIGLWFERAGSCSIIKASLSSIIKASFDLYSHWDLPEVA